MRVASITATHLSGHRAGETRTSTAFPITIGRSPANLLQLGTHDTRASAKHAILTSENGKVFLEDLKSTNGTYLRGRRVTRIELQNGDVVEFGVGGPELRFDFVVTTEDAVRALPMTAPAVPPTVQRLPTLPMSDTQPGHARPMEVDVPPTPVDPLRLDSNWEGNAPSQTMNLGAREFPLRGKFRIAYYLCGFTCLVAGVALFFSGPLVAVPPLLLLGVFLLLIGWSYSRVNITISHEGIEYQGILRQFVIPWSTVTKLRARRSQTNLLNRLVYTVESDRHRLTFSTGAFDGGLELAQLITRRTGRKWE